MSLPDPHPPDPAADRRPLPTPTEIIRYLDRFVYGQEQAKRDLAVSVYNHYLALAYRDGAAGRDDFGKQHILLFGPTGCGKTYLVRTVAQLLGVPVSFASATSLVETGYVGNPVDSVIRNLLTAANHDVYLAQRGIVFLDEIDKIRRSAGVVRDVSGEGVQNGLLALLDGCIVNVPRGDTTYRVDVGQVLFICTGAFVGLPAIIRRRLGSQQLGFRRPPPGGVDERSDDWAFAQVTPEDLEEYGFIPEFIGRFSTLSALQSLSREALARILTETEDSILEKQKVLFGLHGIDLRFTPAAIDAIAEQAYALGTGARGLARIVLRCLDRVDWRLPELAAEGVTAITITPETVRTGAEPEYTRAPAGPRAAPAGLAELRERALRPSVPQTGLAEQPGFVFTDARGLSDDELRTALERVKVEALDWTNTTGSARKWWEAFENENRSRLGLVLRLAEELAQRKATITEFFLAYIYSGTDNIQANLHYLDYTRLKKEEQRKKKQKT
jgi:ATP-dependent Clp protease ATP-binding subunit ClpX